MRYEPVSYTHLPPVLRAVVDGGGREVQADGDDDGAGDDRREEAHDLLGAERFKQRRENHVHKTRARLSLIHISRCEAILSATPWGRLALAQAA